jgi:hypothetical protein
MIGALMTSDAVASAVKATPPVFVTATMKLGVIDWGHLAIVLTVVYTTLQITFLVWNQATRKRGEKNEG